jgi:hypothetical protein
MPVAKVLAVSYSKVTVGAIAATLAPEYSFDAPAVSAFEGRNVAASGSSTVTISGLNFGSYSFTPSGRMGADLCASASWTSQTTLQCGMVGGTTLAPSYTKVTVGAVVGTRASVTFTFDAPAVSFLAPGNVVSCGGSAVSIDGLSFGMFKMVWIDGYDLTTSFMPMHHMRHGRNGG